MFISNILFHLENILILKVDKKYQIQIKILTI